MSGLPSLLISTRTISSDGVVDLSADLRRSELPFWKTNISAINVRKRFIRPRLISQDYSVDKIRIICGAKMKRISRRAFLQSTSTALVAGTVFNKVSAQRSGLVEEPPVSMGLSEWEYRRGSLGGPWEVWRKANDDANVWSKVQVPHCFNAFDAVDPDTPYYQGPGWYRTRFQLANPYPRGRTLLHFEGAGQKTEVYIHTEKAGAHVGGYDEFTVDITDLANKFALTSQPPGTVPVAVMCDNSRDLEMIPSNLSDFNLYGGLYRYVNLVYVPAISLERVLIDPEVMPDGKARITIRHRLYNPLSLPDPVEVSVRLIDPKDVVSSTIIEKPELWSPDNPALYRCTVTLKSPHGSMTVSERFGIRSFEFVKNGPFTLNGQRLLIRGTQRHEDHAGVASAMTQDLIRQEMRLIKNLGANFVRLGHHQQSRVVLDMCDELGLLVWEEIPWCRGGLGGERYKEQARRMLRNLIDQHRNHPSVIIWGLGNENDWPGDFEEFDKDKIRAFMIELNTLAHSLDPSRKTAIRRCDFCKDVVDVYSPSIWAGWYQGPYTTYKDRTLAEMKKVDHFLHMEWGGDSHARRHSETEQVFARASNDGDWSETYI